MSVNSQRGIHFSVHLLNRKSFGRETRQLIDTVRGKIFKKNFARLVEVGPKSRLFYNLSTFHNQKPNTMSLWFFTHSKVYPETMIKRKHSTKNL